MENVNGFQTYIKAIKAIPLLTPEQEKDCAIAALKGSQQAKEKLITSNLRLVVKAAKHYSVQCSLSFEDLVQEGNIGLMRSIESFDPEKGWRFSTYAMYWIKQAISRAILNQAKTIRIPIHILELKSKYMKAERELINTLNREPTSAEIAQKTGIELKKIKEIENLIKEPISLNAALNEEEDGTVEDLVADTNLINPDEVIDNEIRAKVIKDILNSLEERERDIIIARFGLMGQKPQTLDQLGAQYRLTKERIRQIEQKALHKLRNPLRANQLKIHYNN